MGLSHVMPWGIQELLLSRTIKMNVGRKERVRVYEAIKNFLGEDLSVNLPAVMCHSVLISVLNDKVSLQALSALSSMAFVLSDAILCCMQSSGWESHPLYDEIMSGLIEINKKMMQGKKIFQRQYDRKTTNFQQRKGRGRSRRRRTIKKKKNSHKHSKKKFMTITTDKEEFSISVCGDGDSCEACNFLLKKIGDRDVITMDTLSELLGNITNIAMQL